MKTQHSTISIIKLIAFLLFLLLYCLSALAQSYTWYQDADGDNWGNPSVSTTSATKPTGYVLNSLDCDDNIFNTTSWNRIGVTGTNGISASTATQSAIALDANGIPYLAYADVGNSNKLVVRKYNVGKNQWDTIGPVAFSSASPLSVNIAVSTSGTVYVAYQDSVNKATVKKYNSATNTWDLVGSASFTAAQNPLYLNLAIDPSGVPYVVYRDNSISNKVTVRKYDSGTNSWIIVGSSGLSAAAGNYCKLTFDPSGVPYVAYGSNLANVKKYNSGTSSWGVVGPSDFSASTANYMSVAVDATGTAYVAYQDLGNSSKVTVRKYNSAKVQWDTVGTVGFSSSTATYISLALDTAGIPYVAYQDAGNANKATVRKYNAVKNQWDTVSTIAFTNGTTNTVSLVVTPQGISYVGYVDGGSNSLAYVSTLKEGNINASISISASATTVTSGGSVTFTASTVHGGSVPVYQWYRNATIVPGATSATYTDVFTGTTFVHCRLKSNYACGDTSLYILSNGIKINVPGKWYADLDGDGWGDPSNFVLSLTKPAGYLLNNLDCDDSRFNRDTFNYIGTPGFSTGGVSYVSMAVDYTGIPYVAYQDVANSSKATVKKFDGANWVTLGIEGFSDGAASFVSIAVDGAGVPYVVYKDAGNGNKATVKKFDGTSWVNVGIPAFSGGISTTNTDYTSIAIDAYGTPYVAFKDNIASVSSYATVMKFDGNNWVLVGAKGFSGAQADYISMAIDPTTNLPYVVYKRAGLKATIMKYDGVNWVLVGNADISDGASDFTSIAVDPQGTPYVFFRDVANSNKGTAMKFDGTNWVLLGPKAFTPGDANYTKITTNYSGVPYILYRDGGGISGVNNLFASVMRYNGTSWEQVNSPRFSASTVSYEAIAMGPNDVPYVAYQGTSATPNKVSAMKLNIQPFKVLVNILASSVTIVKGASVTFTATATNGGSSPSYQWYKNRLAIAGATSSIYTTTTLTDRDTITCKVVSNDACAGTPSADTIIVRVQQYFRTLASGNYDTLSLWEGSTDSTTWTTAYGIPNKDVFSVEIRHTITDDRSLANAYVPSFTISSAGKYIATGLLGIYGNFINNGTFIPGDRVELRGTDAQYIAGTSPIYFNDLSIKNTSTSGVTFLRKQYIRRLLSFDTTGALLYTGDSLILVSDSNATAGIGPLTGGADVIGKVYYQRYISGGSNHREWRFMSMPIQNQSFNASWQKTIYITGPGSGGSTCQSGNMQPNSNGFDENQGGFDDPTDTAYYSSVFVWDELTNDWKVIESTFDVIDPLKGYRLFIRGDRNIDGCVELVNMPDSTTPVTLYGYGPIVKGTQTLNLSYTPGKGNGWQMLTNPYPCPISWSTVYNSLPPTNSVNAVISIWDPINKAYNYYDGLLGTGTNGGTDQIASGQSFFINNVAPTTITFNETHKSYTPNPGFFGKTDIPQVKIRLEGLKGYDEAIIAQYSLASYAYDNLYDGLKLDQSTAHYSTIFKRPPLLNDHGDIVLETVRPILSSGTTSTNSLLSFNLIPFTSHIDTIPLYADMESASLYNLSFTNSNLDDIYHLWLHDKYFDQYTNVRLSTSIPVITNNETESYAQNRFELLIINSQTDSINPGIQNIPGLENTFSLYPVPTTDVLNIRFNNNSTGVISIEIYDVTGKEIVNRNYTLTQTHETVFLNTKNLTAGAYIIQTTFNGQSMLPKKFIKN